MTLATSDFSSPSILLVPGWTPGPLKSLYASLEREYPNGTIVMSSQRAPLPMPPFTGWIFEWGFVQPFFCSMVALLLGVDAYFFWKHVATASWWSYLLLAGLHLAWLRFMTTWVTRKALQLGGQKILRLLEEHPYDILICYSWGAAVVSNTLLLQQHSALPSKVLLVAPTSAAVGAFAKQPDVVLRLPNQLRQKLHVIHGQQDTMYCPHSERWEQRYDSTKNSNFKFSMLDDNHAFSRRSNRTLILDAAVELVNDNKGSYSGMA